MSDLIEKLSQKMHESWSELKKRQGFHHPKDCKHFPKSVDEQLSNDGKVYLKYCLRCHPDIDIPWEKLSEEQKEINRVGARAMLEELIIAFKKRFGSYNHIDHEEIDDWFNSHPKKVSGAAEDDYYKRLKSTPGKMCGFNKDQKALPVDEAMASKVKRMRECDINTQSE